MKTKINESCNLNTEEHAHGFRSAGRSPKPQITVPAHKLRLSIYEAAVLAAHLKEAVDAGLKEEDKALLEQKLRNEMEWESKHTTTSHLPDGGNK